LTGGSRFSKFPCKGIALISEKNIQEETRDEIRELLDTWSNIQSLRRFFGENNESVSDHPKETLSTMSHEEYSRKIRELAHWGQLEPLQDSYDNYRNPPLVDSSDGTSALHFAAANGHLGIAKFLVQKGSSLTAQDNDGDNPFPIACGKAHDELVRYIWESYLSRGLELAVKNKFGITPLMLAARFCSTRAFLYILERSDENLSFPDCDGYTILHHACTAGLIGKVTALLERGLDATTKTKDGLTPLMSAANDHAKGRNPEDEGFDDRTFPNPL
jgi:hypothetical protein